jgi:hypothetical protein
MVAAQVTLTGSRSGRELPDREHVLLSILVQELAPFGELPSLVHTQYGDRFGTGVVHGQETALGNVAVLNFDPVMPPGLAGKLNS